MPFKGSVSTYAVMLRYCLYEFSQVHAPTESEHPILFERDSNFALFQWSHHKVLISHAYPAILHNEYYFMSTDNISPWASRK